MSSFTTIFGRKKFTLIPIILFAVIVCYIANKRTKEKNGRPALSDEQSQALRDSLLRPLTACLSASGPSRLVWVTGDPATGVDAADTAHTRNIRWMTENVNDIRAFMDAFPHIVNRAQTIRFVRASSGSSLYVICHNDTLLDCSWDPGRYQLSVNNSYYEIDFDRFEKTLDRLSSAKH